MKIKIAVKIGSHLTTVNLNDKIQTCDDFIRVALKQCNLIKSANEHLLNTYALFERLNGIEMIINGDAVISTLWSTKWAAQMNDNNFSLIIKKYRRSETLCKFIEKNEKRMHKLFEISRQMSIQNIATECDKSEIGHFQNTDKLKARLQSLSIYQDKSTSGESAFSNSSGVQLIKNAKQSQSKISEKKKFLKKFLFKTDAHAKNLIRNLSNSSFLSLSKAKVSVQPKLDNTYNHYYEEINDNGNFI